MAFAVDSHKSICYHYHQLIKNHHQKKKKPGIKMKIKFKAILDNGALAVESKISLNGASLNGASLNGASLNGTIGNMTEIFSMQIETYKIAFAVTDQPSAHPEIAKQNFNEMSDSEIKDHIIHAIETLKLAGIIPDYYDMDSHTLTVILDEPI